ncbi:lysophospholipid acyltransferase family protein [Longispora urticae]
MTALYRVAKWVVGAPLRGVLRPQAEGLENIPRSGPAILACNHLSVSDHLYLPLVVNRPIAFMAKAEYFLQPGLKGWARGAMVRGLGQIAVDRSGGRAGVDALKRTLPILQNGGLHGIFPEGTRSPDGRLYKGRTGVARLALEAKVPVIPIGLIGTDLAQPIGRAMPDPRAEVIIKIGKPLYFGRYEGMERDKHVVRAVTDEVMDEIRRLTGQEYVDRYAPRASAVQPPTAA